MLETSNQTGAIRLEGNVIGYSLTESSGWQIPLQDLVVLGEYTNTDGPYLDDYFLVFLCMPNFQWQEASFYADGTNVLLARLGEALGSELSLGLCDSTDFNSRVLWPQEIVGLQLFDFVPIRPTSTWQRIKQWIFPAHKMKITKDVMEYLDGDRDAI